MYECMYTGANKHVLRTSLEVKLRMLGLECQHVILGF